MWGHALPLSATHSRRAAVAIPGFGLVPVRSLFANWLSLSLLVSMFSSCMANSSDFLSPDFLDSSHHLFPVSFWPRYSGHNPISRARLPTFPPKLRIPENVEILEENLSWILGLETGKFLGPWCPASLLFSFSTGIGCPLGTPL